MLNTFQESIMKFKIVCYSVIFFVACSAYLQEVRSNSPKRVCIIGTGYLGLATGGVLAELGHYVVCTDIVHTKIKNLQTGSIPIFEPGLEDLVKKNIEKNTLNFTTNASTAIQSSDIILVTVGTPISENGATNLLYIRNAIQTIAENLNAYKVICIKSTIPIGTHKKILLWLKEYSPEDALYDLVLNPEFLREGTALDDLFLRNPIVLGTDSKRARLIMIDLYQPLLAAGLPLFKTDIVTAESVKYAWNCFSSMRISYINEWSRLCNTIGADIATITSIISLSNELLPNEKLRPGPGLGGSCLPKDLCALINTAKELNINMDIVQATQSSSLAQQKYILNLLYKQCDTVLGKSIAILGLSFKANTNDIRNSASIFIMQELIKKGATIRAYDPQAMSTMKNLIPEVNYCESIEEAASSVDALLILTEWDEFKQIDLAKLKQIMQSPIIIDARNIINLTAARFYGLQVTNLENKIL